MPISLPSSGYVVTGSITTGVEITLTSWTPSTGDVILVGIAERDETKTVQSVVGNNVTFSLVRDHNEQQGQNGMEVWKGVASSPTTGSIVVTVAANNLKPVMCIAARFQGVDNTIPVEVDNSADTGATDNANMKCDITTQTNGAWAVGFGTHRGRTFTVPGGENGISINNIAGTGGDTTSNSCWYESVPSATTIILGADADLNAAEDWVEIVVALKPATAPAAGQPINLRGKQIPFMRSW